MSKNTNEANLKYLNVRVLKR